MNFIGKISVLVAVLLFAILGIQAQESKVGLKFIGGINLSQADIEGFDTDIKVGYKFGVLVKRKLPNNFHFESGLEFSSKGFKYERTLYLPTIGTSYEILWQKASCNAVYLQVPITVGYNVDINKDLQLNFGLGGYLAYGIGGKLKSALMYDFNNGSIPLSADDKVNTFSSEALKRFDMGLTAGIDVKYRVFTFNVGYEYGLINFSRGDSDAKNRNWFLTVGYKFF